jgi:uncharacterized protein (DUF302 family)
MPLTTVNSPHSVAITMDRLVSALDRRGIKVFELAGEQLLIFGDPRVGTALMQADPEIGYELPLRVLVWDAGGQTRVGYRRPSEVGESYSVAAQAEVLARMDGSLEALVAAGVGAATA